MIGINILAYRFSRLEQYLLSRTEKSFLKSGFEFDRWPEVYYGCFNDFTKSKWLQNDDHYIEKDYNIYNPDYLGMYVYDSGSEGHILLFKDRIYKCADRISIKLNLNVTEVVDVLKAIVLIHEFGHWKTHWCHNVNTNQRRGKFINLSKVITESLAQLNVVWSIMKLKNKRIAHIKMVFDYLVSQQEWEYQEFLLLRNKQTHIKTILKRYANILDKGLGPDYLIYGTN